MVLVDTPIWSLALRRRVADLSGREQHLIQTLYQLIQQHRVCLLGCTRQEVLSGIREESQFRRIRDYLRDFSDIPLDTADYEEGAHLSNLCRRAGIAGSVAEMLLCSVSLRNKWEIFTTDGDFAHYSRVLQVRLLKQ
jgi:predicted nucleic acid-binding protein